MKFGRYVPVGVYPPLQDRFIVVAVVVFVVVIVLAAAVHWQVEILPESLDRILGTHLQVVDEHVTRDSNRRGVPFGSVAPA